MSTTQRSGALAGGNQGTGGSEGPDPRLHLHRAVRASDLIDDLAALLADDPLDPFAAEVISVPTPGVERWLSQSLAVRLGTRSATGSDQDGIAAGIDFPPLHLLLARVWSAASATALPEPDRDPWTADRLTWRVLATIEAEREQPWLTPVVAHLGGSSGRRFLTASRIAALFTRYGRERPTLIEAWRSGDDVDDTGAELPFHRSWQPRLWRAVRARIGVASPAERIDLVTETLGGLDSVIALPHRLSVFGLNRLDALDRIVFAGLTRRRDVHLWLAHPSPVRWERIRGAVSPADDPRLTPPRAAPEPDPGRSRLLTSLGREVVEFQHVVGQVSALVDHEVGRPGSPDPDPPPAGGAGRTVLAAVQRSIVTDTDGLPDGPISLTDDDTSLQVHSCHGPDRQAEVVREVVCTLLADDPTLEPRDIVIMCPDPATFAPLVGSVFDATGTTVDPGREPTHPGRTLRIRIADQGLPTINPMLGLVERLFELVDSRISASELIDLCAHESVAARFGFTDDDHERLADLITSSGVRWGLDQQHRDWFGLGAFGQNTVGAGMDRMLLGVAMSEAGHHHLGLALPLDEVESGDAELIGRLVELTHRLRRVIDDLVDPRPIGDWVDSIRTAVDLLAAPSPDQGWQRPHAWVSLGALAGDADTGRDGIAGRETPELDLGDIRALLADALAGRPGRANFATGALTLSSLAPMRSVPHRVVCLLGMDDQMFPRGRAVDGDDLLADRPRMGDRDRRAEDRQLFLDAVMAAGETLVVIHSGRDPRTNQPRPPAVPVGELLDAVDRLMVTDDGTRPRDRLIRQHPLQPYDQRLFSDAPVLHGFDRAGVSGARAATAPRGPAPAVFRRDPLPEVVTGELELTDLTRFYKHPAKEFLRRRGNYTMSFDDDPVEDQLPVELGGLSTWSIGQRMLDARRSGASMADLQAAEWRRGVLPPRALGSRVLDRVIADVEDIMGRAEPYLAQARQQLDVSVRLGSDEDDQRADANGRDPDLLTGTTTAVHGEQLIHLTFSRPNATHLLTAWWELLALTATRPEVGWRAVVLGKGGAPTVLGPVPERFARLVLGDAVDLLRVGLRAPLPLPPKPALRYAQAVQRTDDVRQAVHRASAYWVDQGSDEIWTAFWGPTFDDLLAEPAVESERRGGHTDPSRFGTLARRLFAPLVARAEGLPR